MQVFLSGDDSHEKADTFSSDYNKLYQTNDSLRFLAGLNYYRVLVPKLAFWTMNEQIGHWTSSVKECHTVFKHMQKFLIMSHNR